MQPVKVSLFEFSTERLLGAPNKVLGERYELLRALEGLLGERYGLLGARYGLLGSGYDVLGRLGSDQINGKISRILNKFII